MQHSPSRTCNCCDKRVAVKSILWHTEQPYITVRGDDVPWLPEDNTVPYKLHYCWDCWDKMWKNQRIEAHAK